METGASLKRDVFHEDEVCFLKLSIAGGADGIRKGHMGGVWMENEKIWADTRHSKKKISIDVPNFIKLFSAKIASPRELKTSS